MTAYRPARDVIKLLMERYGFDKERRLAEKLGLEQGDPERQFYRWARGSSEPRYYNTLMLLEEAGFLTEEALAFLREPGRPESDEGELDDAGRARRERERAEEIAERLRPPARARPRRAED